MNELFHLLASANVGERPFLLRRLAVFSILVLFLGALVLRHFLGKKRGKSL